MMYRNLFTLSALLIATFGLAPSHAHANLIVNGDFEDTTDWGVIGSSSWPAGWAGAGANPAGQQSGVNAIGGSGTSAYMPPGSSGYGVEQAFDGTAAAWQLDFDFATEDPGGVNDRSVSIGIESSAFDNPANSFRINGEGDFQVFERGGLSWYTPTGLAGSIIFDTDVQIDPLVHHATIIGHWDDATPNYDIIITDSNGVVHQALGLTSWNKPELVGPSQGDGITEVLFNTSASSGAYLLDNMVLVPEPASMVLMGMGGLLMLRRRHAA